MAGFRSSFIHLCHPLAKLIPTKILLKVCDQPLILPVYHLVSDEAPAHIKHLYQIKSIDEFEADLDYLLHHFQPLSLPELYDVITRKQRLDRPSFFLSFDDGLSEFYHIVAPILEEKELRAINFLNSSFIDNCALFYRYKVSLIIEKIKTAQGDLDLSMIGQIIGGPVVNAAQLILQLLKLKYRHTGQIDALA
ncbi:MAG: hypothetical protein HKN87_10295, partial [Saprospiraceae bacterium]|nr:hypothetical protein [Saprospiraceae bacterium]